MKKKYLFNSISLLSVLLLILAACHKHNDPQLPPPPVSDVDVYVVGHDGFRARLWKNGTATSLSSDEPMHWVNGQHEAIMSEAIFVRVQQVLDDRKRGQVKKKFIEQPQLILRGFLTCPDCGRMLTGSASTGSYSRYYYYHCRTSCRYRKRSDSINEIFTEELIKWRPNEAFLPLFKSILKECYEIKMCLKIEKRETAIKQLDIEHSRFNRARELLLSENLSLVEFETIKTDYITKLRDLHEILDNTPDYIEKFGVSVHNQGSAILRLYDFFKMANTTDQRRLIGLISPANLTFKGTGFDIKQYGLAMKLIYHS